MNDPTIEITIDDITPEMVQAWIDTHSLKWSDMSRSLITRWDSLRTDHHEGDRLSIFVTDARIGKVKILDCHIYGVYREGDAEFEEECENWPGDLLKHLGNDDVT